MGYMPNILGYVMTIRSWHFFVNFLDVLSDGKMAGLSPKNLAFFDH